MTQTTIELDYPFEFEGEKITEINLRRAKYKDLKAARAMKEIDVQDYLFSTLSEHPPELFAEMDPVDIVKIEKVIMGFLGLTAES